ncbi:MAG: phosphoribosylpyrophosphate synthetase [Ferruginibacter sp.]
MKTYDTVTEALKDLKLRGFTTDFNIAFDKLMCSENKVCLNPDEFEIVEVYRFEGETDPGDENVVYAVESKDGKIKGSFISAFGTYAESASNEMVRKLSMHK